MAEITLPGGLTPNVVEGTLTLEKIDSTLTNWKAQSQYTVFPNYNRWIFSFMLPALDEPTARTWAAALEQLADPTNYFRISPPNYTGPTGDGGFTDDDAQFDGGSQSGTTLNLKNVDPNVEIFKAGDWISWIGATAGAGDELHRIAAGATADGIGDVTVTLTTPIRDSMANNGQVRLGPTNTPRLRCVLESPVTLEMDWTNQWSKPIVVRAVEDVPAI